MRSHPLWPHLNIQSTRCSKWDVQAEAILALKASVQVATQSPFMAFVPLVGLGKDEVLDWNEMPTGGITWQSSLAALSSEHVSKATKMTSSRQNPVRLAILFKHYLADTDGSLARCIGNGKHAPSPSSYGSRSPSACSPVPADWLSPFSLPDPLALDHPRACTMSKNRRACLATIIPEIVIEDCGASDPQDVPLRSNRQKRTDHSSPVRPQPIATAIKPTMSELLLPPRARARVSVRSSYNELHLLGSLVE
jgi:hypothetical protein